MDSSLSALLRVVRGPERSAPGPEGKVVVVLRPYEVMVILDAGLEDDALRASVDRLTDLISANGGTPGRVDRWGRRRFAYEMNHRWEGYYVLVEATAEPAAMAAADRMLHLADEVLRHKIIRLPDEVAGRSRPGDARAVPESEEAAPVAATPNGA